MANWLKRREVANQKGQIYIQLLVLSRFQHIHTHM